MLLNDVKDIDLFADLTDEQFDVEVRGEVITLNEGEALFYEGDAARNFYVILEGTLEVYRMIKGQKVVITTFTKGMTGGEVPLLSGTPHLANGVALTTLKLLKIDEKDFWTLIGNCGTVRSRVLANMAGRTQALQRLSYQREKLASLGTMAAGLAHELNNPASAAKRTAENLSNVLHAFNRHSSEMLKWAMFKPHVDKEGFPFQPLVDIMQIEGLSLDPLDKGDLEDDLADWLEAQGIEDPWDAAGTLVSVGFTRENLSAFVDQLVPEHVTNSLSWLHKDVEMRLLSAELMRSTARISELVTAMKSYTYMDKLVERIKIDLHEGIDNTLIILNHKLKRKNITVQKDYDQTLPKISAYGSELNQVWTNLIDNAVDAVSNGGTIRLRTYRSRNDPKMVVVDVIDDGAGIPKEIADRVFDPFFTTKGPGEGTGLGLEISYRIIVNQHKGTISIASENGLTTCRVHLPVDL